jgi:hypothetical protein
MQERLQSAENAIKERQRELSMDHGGTQEERQAIDSARRGSEVFAQRRGSMAEAASQRESAALLDWSLRKRKITIPAPQLGFYTNANIVAVFRTFPAMDMSASDTCG